MEPGADLRAEDVELSALGSSFTLDHRGARAGTRLPLLGRFNVENALAAAGAAVALGMSLEDVARRLEAVPQIPGRLERVAEEPAPVLIDFAHTPDALETVLATLRPLVEGRLIVVFGAGGDRDRSKRRPMAEAVARYADVIVLTSDNPRTENPEAILDDLEQGLSGTPHERIADRREAIHQALDAARGSDLVLLAGKGHETYQVVGRERRPFDERVVVRDHLARRGVA
jgi:UDP-N-acetylmuramoyl-L-alanyl-D-glutamate--2,6-diaminopimelate ligase